MSFPQGGQLDWVGLASTVITTPLGILGRLSQAGVDQYTIEIAKVFGAKFNIRSSYLDAVDKKLARTGKFGISSDILFFGTGISIIPRLLGATRGGVAFAAIVMALSSTYSANYIAHVLIEMVQSLCPEELSVPSVSQFEALVNEVVATNVDREIGRLVLGLELSLTSAIPSLEGYDSRLYSPPVASEMAAAILAIAQLPSDQGIDIRTTIPSVSWIAAFAHTVAGLRVSFQTQSTILWESSAYPQSDSVSRGLATIRYMDSTPSTHEHRVGANQIAVLSKARIELSLGRLDPDARSTMYMPLSDGIAYLMRLRGIKTQPELDQALLSMANEMVALKGSAIIWNKSTFMPNSSFTEEKLEVLVKHNPRFDPSKEAILKTCRPMVPTSTITFRDLVPTDSPETRSIIQKLHQINHGLPHSRIQDYVLLIIAVVLQFVDSDVELDLDRKQLYLLAVHCRESVFHGSEGANGRPVICIVYEKILPQLLMLFHGREEHAYDPNDTRPSTVTAVSTGGRYTVINMTLEPCQDHKTGIRVRYGHGGIFLNQKSVSTLESFTLGMFGAGNNLPLHLNPEPLKRHGIRREASNHSDVILLMELLSLVHPSPSTTASALPFQVKLFYNQTSRGGAKIAWSVSARDGIDIAFDAMLSPSLLLNSALNQNTYDSPIGRQYKQMVERPYVVCNLESFLISGRDTAGKVLPEKTIVLAQGNEAAQLLVLSISRLGIKIRHTPDMSLEESLKDLDAYGHGTIILV